MSHYFFIWSAYGAAFCGLVLLTLSVFLEKKRLEKTYKKLEAKQRNISRWRGERESLKPPHYMGPYVGPSGQ